MTNLSLNYADCQNMNLKGIVRIIYNVAMHLQRRGMRFHWVALTIPLTMSQQSPLRGYYA